MKNIIEGKNDFLFQTDEFVIELITGKIPLSPEDTQSWLELMNSRIGASRSRGAEYFLFVAPEKHVVYKKYLPEDVIISTDRPVIDLARTFSINKLDKHFLYPVNALSGHAQIYSPRAEMGSYDRYESHWNGYGVFVAYLDLCKKLNSLGRAPVPSIDPSCMDFSYENQDGHCDLGLRLIPPKIEPHLGAKKIHPEGRCIFDNTKFSAGNLKVLVNKDKSLPRLVIFRDSFSNLLLPLLAESFSRIVAIATWHLLVPIIESERPDYVVTQIAERYLSGPHIKIHAASPDVHCLCGMTVEQIKDKA